MAGLRKDSPQPTAITVHEQSRVLEVAFDDGSEYRIPFELMRVYSPSAEVQGHGPGQEVLQTGKREVGINELTAVGHYAVQPHFSDGHDTRINSKGMRNCAPSSKATSSTRDAWCTVSAVG